MNKEADQNVDFKHIMMKKIADSVASIIRAAGPNG
jgi:hypothetical protein